MFLGMVVHTCNVSTPEREEGRSRVGGHIERPSSKKKEGKKGGRKGGKKERKMLRC
jgi:hypothetical protein